MSRADVHAAVVAFLGQFVGRGASPELHGLAHELPTDAMLQSQLDEFLTDEMTERQGFDAMRAFLAEWSSRIVPARGEVDVFLLLSWTEWEPDGQTTSDPAQWHDWLAAVASSERR
jgi:hypothetical protein